MKAESIFWDVPIFEVSTAGGLWAPRACRLWGQSREVRGSTDDAKGRHRTCAELIVTSKHKEREAIVPP